jgi:uncharacterized protein DUF4058
MVGGMLHISQRSARSWDTAGTPRRRGDRYGREEYLNKQEQILASGTHPIEIDLLRMGYHTVACPTERPPIPYQYLVCINRAAQGWAVYFIPLQRRLPRIGIPLRKPDSDFVLDLQEILHRCYGNGGYEDFIDYRRPPHATAGIQRGGMGGAVVVRKRQTLIALTDVVAGCMRHSDY